jgi:ABC-type Fe3+-hydroxamate transport system substrate-binding protein
MSHSVHAYLLTRRRLLQGLLALPASALIPAFGQTLPPLNTPPDMQRIIALEWLPVELLLALGVMPMAVAEIANYRWWVEQPALAAQVIDVGQRAEPNLELIQQLAPSLLLISSGFGPRAEQLRGIAPVMSLQINNPAGGPLQQASAALYQLAEKLQLMPRAQAHMQQVNQEIALSRRQLSQQPVRSLLLFTLLDSRHVLVFGRGSLLQDVLDNIGMTNAWQGASSFWGSVTVSLEQLATVGRCYGICFTHGDDALFQQVQTTPLWQALPFVADQQCSRVPALWFYGATFAAMRFCQILRQTLCAEHVGRT